MIIESDFYSTEAGRAHFQDQLTSKSMTTPRPPVESFLLANLFSHFFLSVLCAIVKRHQVLRPGGASSTIVASHGQTCALAFLIQSRARPCIETDI